MRRILRTLPKALVIACVGIFGTLALSGCDEWAQDQQGQDREQQQQRQAPSSPPPQP